MNNNEAIVIILIKIIASNFLRPAAVPSKDLKKKTDIINDKKVNRKI